MKRVNQHIIEEESRKAFALLIPDSWVANDFTKDYGKDIHIEIFSNYLSTGNTFIVQLKGTTQKVKNGKIAIQMSVETLLYYETLDIPVLLVFYSTNEKQFWGIWANRLLNCLNVTKGQATVLVKMDARQFINTIFFKELEMNFTNKIYERVQFVISSKTALEKALERRIIRWLEKYYPGSYGLNNAYYPFCFRINLFEGNKQISINISINEEELSLEPIREEDIRFITSPIVNPDNLKKEEAEILFFVTSIFSKFSPQHSLLLLQKIIVLYHGIYKNETTLLQIGDFALEANCLFELQQLINITLQEKLLPDFNNLNIAFFRQKRTIESYKANLVRAIEIFPNSKDKGTLCYNLGNLYRSQYEYTLTVKYYNLARKYCPNYLNRYYWWHELAGVLYLTQHYFYASIFYEKSIELDKESKSLPFTYALHADCLLWQGKYKAAKQGYDIFLKQVVNIGKIPSPYQSMLHDMCREFIEMGFEEKELNIVLSSKLYNEASKSNDAELYYNSIEAYPLNFHAWRSLGYIYQSKTKYVEAFNALRNAAILHEVDKDTWLHCYIMCIKAGDNQFETLIFSNLLFQFGEGILNDFNEIIYQYSDISIEEQENIMFQLVENAKYLIDNVIKDIYMPPPISIRLMNDDEFYEIHP